MKQKRKNRTRLSLDIDALTNTRIMQLRTRYDGVSITEVIRMAVDVLYRCNPHSAELPLIKKSSEAVWIMKGT